MLCAPSAASATALYTGSLQPQQGYSASATYTFFYVEATANHTTCVGAMKGGVGYFAIGGPGITYQSVACTNGSGTYGNYFDGGTSYWRPAVVDPNVSTVNYIYASHYTP